MSNLKRKVWITSKGLTGTRAIGKKAHKNWYTQSKLTLGLWTHHTQPIIFCLIVNDFGVKYKGQEHANHLHILVESYKITTDWRGKKTLDLF